MATTPRIIVSGEGVAGLPAIYMANATTPAQPCMVR